MDPGAVPVIVTTALSPSPDAVDLTRFSPWLTVVDGQDLREHAVLSDGWRRVRIDIEGGTLRNAGTVVFHYGLSGVQSAHTKVLPLRRLISLFRAGRFASALYPYDRRLPRWIDYLRVADARANGASYRDIASTLFGEERTSSDWHQPGRSMHSQVRRLVAGAGAMTAGGYRDLLRSS